MPPDLPNEQELTLKKRARRRLVGAIALVLLMVIILPQVLQDRTLSAQQEPIRITMPELVTPPAETVVNDLLVTGAANSQLESQELAAVSPENSFETASDNQDLDINKPVAESATVKIHGTMPLKEFENKVAVKTPEAGKSQTQTSVKPQEAFTVQVGVYSDADNVKRLQEQLKQIGFSTHTEKVNTPKGDSLRLQAGHFNSREDAVAALTRIKAIGLSGIVIANE